MYNKNRPKRLRPKLYLGSNGGKAETTRKLRELLILYVYTSLFWNIGTVQKCCYMAKNNCQNIYKKKKNILDNYLWRVLVFMGFNKFNKSITQTYNSNIHSPSRTSDQLSSVTSIGLHCVCEKNRIVTETNKTWNIFPDSCARASFPTAMGLD